MSSLSPPDPVRDADDLAVRQDAPAGWRQLANHAGNATLPAAASFLAGAMPAWAVSFLEHTTDCIAVIALDGRMLWINDAFARTYGWSREEIVRQRMPMVSADLRDELARLLAEVGQGRRFEALETVWPRKDGTPVTVAMAMSPIEDADGRVVACAGISREVGERVRLQRLLVNSEQRYRSLFSHNPDAVFSLDMDGCFSGANPACEALTSYSEQELVRTPFMRLIAAEDVDHVRQHIDTAWHGQPRTLELAIRRRDGALVDLSLAIIPIVVDGKTTGVYGIAQDITERKSFFRAVQHQALHDPLTDLPNRTLFQDRLEQELARCRRGRLKLAVLFLDLDGFKQINDTLGHDVGDELLVGVATRLRALLRANDTVARMGGDEFTVLLPELPHDQSALAVAAKVVDALRAPWLVRNRSLSVTTSIGVALYPDDGADTQTLLMHADSAMYAAKEQGRNQHSRYRPLAAPPPLA